MVCLGRGWAHATAPLIGWALLCTACSVQPPPKATAWIDLNPRERADRLFDTSRSAARTLRLEDSQVRFVELGPTTTSPAPARTAAPARTSPLVLSALPTPTASNQSAPWLFLHGLGGSLGDFAPLMLAAAEQQRVFALDLPGFGGSISLDADYSIAGYVHTLRHSPRPLGLRASVSFVTRWAGRFAWAWRSTRRRWSRASF